jgi:LmbE family N-acetylglucosaminyl deacetylase
MPLASIVIPSYQHAHVLSDAIRSAACQTASVEVIVVDDGSTDGTSDVTGLYEGSERIRVLYQQHEGVSAARNLGLSQAHGAFVMFLDADDTIEPTKVADQIAAFTDDVGWVTCDVAIQDDASKRTELASDRYRYKERGLGGWMRDQLVASNFLPIMSPMVRRSVLEGLRFDDSKQPEDWHFWIEVASRARMRYLPKVLATYRKRRTGRHADGIPVTLPETGRLLLNLGCGTPGARSWHPLPGCVNLDGSMGVKLEDGLPQYADASVDGVTLSHVLMYPKEADWPAIFAEIFRVLKPGGVVRITEDDAVSPKSSRRGGWRGSESAVTLTSAKMVLKYLRAAGFASFEVTAGTTKFSDSTLQQAHHGEAPDVFFVEGVKQARAVLFSPHADDETLFAAFTVIREQPRVVVCFPSAGDYGSTDTRHAESAAAVELLGGGPVDQWQGGDIEAQMRELDRRLSPPVVFAPHVKSSHPDHQAVAKAAKAVFGARVQSFHTYVDGAKVRDGAPVPFEPSWVGLKLRALASYQTQIAHPRASRFFADDLIEYTESSPC